MKIVLANKIIDLDKFESIQYKEKPLINSEKGYPIVALRKGAGFWGDGEVEEELARTSTEECAQDLVKAILEAWLSGSQIFDIAKWLNERKN